MPPLFADLGAALRAHDYDKANEVLPASSIMSVPPESADRVRSMVQGNTRLWTIPYSLVRQLSPPATERLETIRTPALVLVGENDLEAVRSQGRLLGQRLADARLVTIAGGGHLLNLTSPDAFREAVTAFLGLS